MLDGYDIPDVPALTTLKDLRDPDKSRTAGAGYAARPISLQLGKYEACIVNIKDADFLAAAKMLSKQAGFNSLRDFMQQALEKEFGADILLPSLKEEIAIKPPKAPSSLVTDDIDAVSGGLITPIRTKTSDDGTGKTSVVAAIVHESHHRFLQSIRTSFNRRSRGKNIRVQLSDILLKKFMQVTDETHLESDLVYQGLYGGKRAKVTRATKDGWRVDLREHLDL